MESIKAFVRPIITPIAKFLNVRNLYAGLILVGVVLVLVAAITIAIVCSVKSKKRKKEALAQAKAKANEEKAKQTSIVQQSVAKENASAPVEVKTEEIKEESKPSPNVEQVKEEQPAVEEVKAEEVKEESKTGPVAEQVKEPIQEKKEPAKKPTAKKTTAKKSLPGKWVIELKSQGEFMSKLFASNGEIMLSSEIYSSEEGARAGISTIIKWVEEGNFVIYQDKKKNYYYKLKTSGNRLICVGEIYKSEEQCLKAVESVKRIAKGAIISEELVEGARYIDYKPVQFDQNAKGPKGKWKVEVLDDGKFSARLYASNGQLMIATEEVALRKTALNAIEAVKKNSIEGNFIVDKDKFGRFYYKLRNAQKSVICIGEAYDSLDACTKALESVRRFAVNSIVIHE